MNLALAVSDTARRASPRSATREVAPRIVVVGRDDMRPFQRDPVDPSKLRVVGVSHPGGPVRQVVVGQDWISEQLRAARGCLSPFGLCPVPTGYAPQVPQATYAPQAPAALPMTDQQRFAMARQLGGYGGMFGCGPDQAPISYAGDVQTGIAGAASVTSTISPTVVSKVLKLVIPGGANWSVTAVDVANKKYISSALGISGAVFTDSEDQAGRLTIDQLIGPSQAIIIKATNITNGALDWRPTLYLAIPG